MKLFGVLEHILFMRGQENYMQIFPQKEVFGTLSRISFLSKLVLDLCTLHCNIYKKDIIIS